MNFTNDELKMIRRALGYYANHCNHLDDEDKDVLWDTYGKAKDELFKLSAKAIANYDGKAIFASGAYYYDGDIVFANEYGDVAVLRRYDDKEYFVDLGCCLWNKGYKRQANAEKYLEKSGYRKAEVLVSDGKVYVN